MSWWYAANIILDFSCTPKKLSKFKLAPIKAKPLIIHTEMISQQMLV